MKNISSPGNQSPNLGALSNGDNTVDADETFQDDLIGAKLKQQEAAKRRNAQERANADSRRRLAQWQKVMATSTFTNEGDQQERQRINKNKQTSFESQALETASNSASMMGEATIEQHETKVVELMEELNAVLEQINHLEMLGASQEVLDEIGQNSQTSETALKQTAKLLELSQQISAIENAVKDILMAMLIGGLGFRLYNDPRITFKRLLTRISHWPNNIPPQRHPQSQEEFDAFIAWVFSPIAIQEDIELPW
ncbi:MAG: hypothetical protein JW841_00525 [Deltaproteobacteria bacterium]|nr:hypothetical protein [Deltaproteobacteria bacterium]